MISLVALVAIVVFLGRLLLSNSNDTKASIADSSIPDEVTSSIGGEDDSAASSTITITMYALPDE